MPKSGGSATRSVAVDTVAKLLKKLGGKHDIGEVYEYTYQGKVVLTVDSTKAGKLSLTVAPSEWAVQIADYIWQYELDEDEALVEPTISDPAINGWSAVMLTDAPEDIAEEESAEEESEEDSETAQDPSTEDEA